MSLVQLQPQPTILRATSRNPGLSDGTIELEFSYAPQNDSVGIRYVENASFSDTLGGQERKQSDAMVRRVDIKWKEYSDFIPMKVLEMMRGGGNRARNNLTYIHHRKILSQLPGIEVEHAPGIGMLQGHIRLWDPVWIGKEDTNDVYQCRLVFQEGNEVVP